LIVDAAVPVFTVVDYFDFVLSTPFKGTNYFLTSKALSSFSFFLVGD